jgi:hypothetical protein
MRARPTNPRFRLLRKRRTRRFGDIYDPEEFDIAPDCDIEDWMVAKTSNNLS